MKLIISLIIIIIISVVVGELINSILCRCDKEFNQVYMLQALCKLCVSLIVFCVLSFIIYGVIPENCKMKEQINTEQIICLNDSTSINGRMYLRSAYINQTEIYKYYVKNNNRGYIYQQVNANKCIIFQDGDTSIVKHYYIYDNKFIRWAYGDDNYNLIRKIYYEIHIPKDSITTEFNIDLNN